MKKLMVIAVVLVFITGSAYAAEWDFYGSARVSTFYSQIDVSPFAGGADTENYEQALYGNSRIGAKVKVSDELTGHFEYGALNGVNVRILWGEWNFGAGSLGIGQNYTPLLFPYSNQVYSLSAFNKGDHDMSTFGMLYGGRKAQIQLKIGGLQIALVEPKTLVTINPQYWGSQPSTEVAIPQIQAKYQYDFDKGHVAIAGGYSTFDVLSGITDDTVNSYLVGLGGRLNVGAAYFKGNVWGGQNTGTLADILVSGSLWSTLGNAGSGTFDGAGWGLAQWDVTTSTLTDKDCFGALIVAGYEIRKGLYMEAGYGYVSTELDTAGTTKDDATTYYLQATIFLAPGVFLTPEIGKIDGEQDGQIDITYYGLKWQINF